ncbi:hypothetical protein DITRI_Ditri20bG0125400 [Diplodiscus trichospermus]
MLSHSHSHSPLLSSFLDLLLWGQCQAKLHCHRRKPFRRTYFVSHFLVSDLKSFERKMQASDRFNINSQLEHLQAKYVGTGHADLSRFEWAVNIQRDSYASYVGHYPMLAYFAVAENESIGRERYNFMQKMLLPCGLPPEREDD